MDDAKKAAALRERMEQVRQGVRHDMEELVDAAHTLASWQYYVRAFPLTCLGVAAGLGFLIVPRKAPPLRIVTADGTALKEWVEKGLTLNAKTKNPGASTGIAGRLVGFASKAALRAMLGYVGNYVIQRARQNGVHSGVMAQQPSRPRPY